LPPAMPVRAAPVASVASAPTAFINRSLFHWAGVSVFRCFGNPVIEERKDPCAATDPFSLQLPKHRAAGNRMPRER
jgi:hypothetical protein